MAPGKKLGSRSALTMMRAPRFAAPALSTADMVLDAVRKYEGKGGMSLQAIKSYISMEYQVDMDRYVPLIRKSIMKAIISGALIRTKGVGVSGSFKLGQGKAKGNEGSKMKMVKVKKTNVDSSSKAKKNEKWAISTNTANVVAESVKVVDEKVNNEKNNEDSAAGKKKLADSIKPKSVAASTEKRGAASSEKDADAEDEPLPKVKKATKEMSKPKETKKAVAKKAKKPALMLPRVIKKN